MDVARRRRQAAKGVWAELKENQPAAGIKSFQTCVNAYFLKLWIKYLVRNQNEMWNNVKENKKNKDKKQKKQFISSCHFNFFSFIFYLLGYQKKPKSHSGKARLPELILPKCCLYFCIFLNNEKSICIDIHFSERYKIQHISFNKQKERGLNHEKNNRY